MADELIEQGHAGDLDSETQQTQRLRMANWLRWSRIVRPASQHSLFCDPAWDTLLELYLDVDQHTLCTVSNLATLTGVGPRTIKRWLVVLEQAGYVQKLPEHGAGFALSALGFETMNKYLDTLLSEMWRLDCESACNIDPVRG